METLRTGAMPIEGRLSQRKGTGMRPVNYGICTRCRNRVPSEHVFRDGKVFIRKDCPDCGVTESLLSSDAATWQRKRKICRFDPQDPIWCTLKCEACQFQHRPRMVFLDLTNRCNMNCPICIANIPGMGFEFHPPLSYFENVLGGLGRMQPRPVVQLFGGEPTVREDLFEIIDIARRNGLEVRIVTNGLKLADEQYCKRLCDAEVPVLLAFDGRDPEIYERLRKNRSAYHKKVKALENLKKYSKRKNTIMCCVARHVNDRHIRDLIDFCHQNRDHIKCMHLIPLTETWEEGEFETDIATTMEDVEHIVDDAFPEQKVEFFPAGPSESLTRSLQFFGAAPPRFGGVHPNCETATYMLSDGERYRPLNYYLKRSIDYIVQEVVGRAGKVNPRLAALDPDKWLSRRRGQFIVLCAFSGLTVRSLRFRRLLKGNWLVSALRILGGLLVGKRLKDQLRRHTAIQDGMLMVVLPFEEYHSVESARLQNCPSGFAYEDPDTGTVKTIPVCMWGVYKREIQRKISARYQAATVTSEATQI